MNPQAARLNKDLSARAKSVRRRENLERIEEKRVTLVNLMAGDEAEREALAILSYAQLICRLHGTPPTLPLTVEQATYIETGRGTLESLDATNEEDA